MADIREEDFTRMQAQIIELRTANYETEVKFQRQVNELEQLQEKSTQFEKELEKSNKIIQKSKNKKEYALLLDENEGLQHRLKDHEEDFKLQNRTLREEVTRIETENKHLVEEIKNLKVGKVVSDSGSSHEAELRRLKAENAALQKSLKGLCEDEVLNVGEKDEDGSSAGTSVLHSKNLHVDGVDNQSEKLEEGSDKSEPTCETENPQEKLSTDKDIKDELGTLVDSAFETFCNSLDKNVSAGVEAGALTNDANISSEEESAAVLNDTEGEKHCFQYSDEDFGCLKTNIISDVSNLLMARDVCAKSKEGCPKCLTNQNKADEAISHMKHSTQLTELQLNLSTEREEKRLLEEQLENLEESLRKEISKLKEEVEKLTEKAKRKQESFTQLQEEKENLYNENRKTIEEMKQSHSNEIKMFTGQTTQLTQELEASMKDIVEYRQTSEDKIKELNEKLVTQENQATSNVEETIQELDNVRIENSSLCEQLQSLHEACEAYRSENEDQKAMMLGMEEKIKETENRETTLNADKEKVKSDLEECRLSYEHLRRQVDEMMNEKEQYLQSTNEATKLAEKRKQLLDEFSIEQQKISTDHKEQMENLEINYKEAAKNNEDEYKKTIEDLKTQLQGEKKLKKELEEKKQQLVDTSTQLTSIQSKCGWFERRLTETEEVLKQERGKGQETVEELKTEHESNIKEISTQHSVECEELNEKIKVMEEGKREQINVIEKFKQEIKDKDVENVIAGKKGDHLVKDLKRQLKTERKKSEQLQQRLQEATSENRARENFEKLFDPNVSRENARRNSGDSSMLSGSSLTFDQESKEPSPDASFNVSLNDETTDLIARVADLQQEKWQLEERVRHLEENCAAMAEDLMQKSAVIQHYAMDTKHDGGKDTTTTVPGSNFKSRMKDTFNIGKQEELLKDMNKKLQRMLEETLMKNIQLQKDVDILTQEKPLTVKDHCSKETDS